MRLSTLLLSVLIIISIQCVSQQPSLVIQQGHKSTILFDDFNIEQAAWLTADANEAFYWNIPTGRQLRRISIASKIRGKTGVVKNGDEIVLAAYDFFKESKLYFYNARTGEQAGELEFFDNSYNSPTNRKKNWRVIDQIARNQDGSLIAIGSFDKLHLADAPARKFISEFNLPSYQSKFGFISNKNLIIVTLVESKLVILKVDENGKVLKKISIDKNTKPESLETHFELPLAAIGCKDGTVYILDDELQIKKEIPGMASVEDLAFNSAGNEIMVSAGKTTYRYDLIKNDTSNFKVPTVPGEKIAFCPTDENNMLAYHSQIPVQYNWKDRKRSAFLLCEQSRNRQVLL